jgi:hypothetical protein
MPLLDPSTILLDPMLADRFDVVQRPEIVTVEGVSTTPTSTRVANIVGVVQPASPDDLQRLDDNDRGQRSLKIYTRFRLNTAAVSRKPDLIIWRGDTFIVKSVDPYTGFGAGWTEVLATSIDSVEALT